MEDREFNTINKDTWGDYTGDGPWTFNGDIYKYVCDELINGDGEWHRVICQREKDKKFFEFSWGYDNGKYFYEDYLDEVFKKIVKKIIYE